MLIIILDCFANARNDGISGCLTDFTSLRENRKIFVAIQKKTKAWVGTPNSHSELDSESL